MTSWVNKVLGTTGNPFKMKVAVIKLGSRISFNANDTSGGNGEARSIIKILETAGIETHIFTKILKKDDLLPQYKWHNLSNAGALDGKQLFDHEAMNQCDALLVINGNVNFFGGAEDAEQIMNYYMINHFAGPVFYAYCDPALTLKQLWPAIEKKPWAGNWKKEDIEIVRDDIIYLSQPYDVEKVQEQLGKNCVQPADIIHFPFEQFPCLNEQLQPAPLEELEVDLSYGGTMRGGKRIMKMVEFYFGHEGISVEMFGKITKEDFTEHPKIGNGLKFTYKDEWFPKFTGPVKYAEMLPKMNKALAHVVIGDPLYEQINDMAQRAYESIWSGVITFIDKDLDSLRRVYGADKELADFLYVASQKEVNEKIKLIKADPQMRQQLLDDQLKAIAFNPQNYAMRLRDLLASGSEAQEV